MTTAFLISGFLLGLLGSVHCVGMCGPLALSLPVQHLTGTKRIAGIILYNFGRVTTYAILGLIFGLAGRSFSLFGWQQKFSIVLGFLLIAVFLISVFHVSIGRNRFIEKQWNPLIIKHLYPLFSKKSLSAVWLIGILNGLLPCGFVYMAIAGALATGKVVDSSLFMAAFGFGTIPAMFLLSFAGSYLSVGVRNNLRKLSPFVFAFMGVLLILRGLNLDIPFISPAMAQQTVETCH